MWTECIFCLWLANISMIYINKAVYYNVYIFITERWRLEDPQGAKIVIRSSVEDRLWNVITNNKDAQQVHQKHLQKMFQSM